MKWLGIFFGVCGIVGVVWSLIADKIVNLYYDFDNTKSSVGYCGWQKSTGSDDYWSVSGKYSDCCSNTNNDCCDAETAGTLWMLFSVFAALFGIIGLIVACNCELCGQCKIWKRKCPFLAYYFACICTSLAMVLFFTNNDGCWGSQNTDDDYDDLTTERMGISAYLMIIASVVFVFAGLFTCLTCRFAETASYKQRDVHTYQRMKGHKQFEKDQSLLDYQNQL